MAEIRVAVVSVPCYRCNRYHRIVPLKDLESLWQRYNAEAVPAGISVNQFFELLIRWHRWAMPGICRLSAISLLRWHA